MMMIRGVVVLLSCIAMVNSMCVFSSDLTLMTDYLMNQDNLYCWDAPADQIVLSYASLCSDGISSIRDEPLGTKCADDYTQVGYPQYNCNAETGVIGSEVLDDANLTPYTACVSSTDNICTSVESANSDNQLVSNDWADISNIPLETLTNGSVNSSAVYWYMGCKSGYGYMDGVDAAYAVCTDSSSNTYTFLDGYGDGTCYAKCGDGQQISVSNTDSIDMDGDSLRNGESGGYEVTCTSGFALEYSLTDDEYTFTCAGATDDDANYGDLTCDDCPVCLAKCPASPSLSDFLSTYSYVSAIDITDSTAKGEIVSGEISCDDGYGPEVGSESYNFMCDSSVNDTDANSGTYVLSGDDEPTCYPKCYITNKPTIGNVTFISLDSDDEYFTKGTVVTGSVNCANDYDLAYGVDNEFDFVCGSSDDGSANSGYFECDGDCPTCYLTCTLPEDTDEFHYELLGTVNQPIDSNDEIPFGYDHIEISCQNDTLNLVGERFLDCIDGVVTYNGDSPYCADVDVCEVPSISNGYTDTNANLMVGDTYTLYCNPSYYFDIKTAGKYGIVTDGTIASASFSQISVDCEGEELPSFECYYGCTPPDFSGGVTYPDMVEEGGAPYPVGQTVTFSCLDDGDIEGGEAEATCSGGEIGSPICDNSAATASTALSLVLATLYALLH